MSARDDDRRAADSGRRGNPDDPPATPDDRRAAAEARRAAAEERRSAAALRRAHERELELHTPVAAHLDVRVCTAAALVGLSTGVLAVAFRRSLELMQHGHDGVAEWALDAFGDAGGLAVLVAVAALLGAIARWLVAALAPETAGSGIPGVEARLGKDAPMRWRRILPVKFFGGLAALATGMSLGREGPTVQMGAALGEAVGEGTMRASHLRKALVAAGAGAGITGAFDAPLAGFLFVIEELRWEITALTYTTALIATLSAQLVIQIALGPDPLFGRHNEPLLPALGFAAAAACGALGGLVGVLYNRAVLAALDFFDRWRSVPLWVHGALAGAVAIAIGYFVPGALFGGDPIAGLLSRGGAQELVSQQTIGSPFGHLPVLSPAAVLLVLAAAKMFLTATSYGSGVVGGLFAPQLVIGACIGAFVAELVRPWLPGAYISGPLAGAGAIAVFTSSVRVPATGLILIVEMTGSATQAFPWSLAAAISFIVATAMREKPIYEALVERAAERG